MRKYVVVQKGIYYQDVYGPFSTVDRALVHAQYRAETDVDDYHEYVVLRVTIDGLTEHNGAYRKNGIRMLHEATMEEWRRFPRPIVPVDADYAEQRGNT